MAFSICTGITPNYLQRARAYLGSLNTHAPDSTVVCVDFSPADMTHAFLGNLPRKRLDYSTVQRLPKWMLQQGAFTAALDKPMDDVVAFTDADAVLQRPFIHAEVQEFIELAQPGVFLAGRNNPNPAQTLEDEAKCIFPKCPPDEISRRFPAHEKMLCKNWGFVVARIDSWIELRNRVMKSWPLCEATFGHYAAVQWICCYEVQRHFCLKDIPLTIHAHGHLGMAPGVTRGPDCRWYYDGKLIAFAHAL